jgi:protein gp37
MSDNSQIEWTDATWSPVTGCTKVSEGCRNCWAARLAAGRLKHNPRYRGLAHQCGSASHSHAPGAQADWTGEVRLHLDLLNRPLHWRKPRKIFVVPHGDLFHPAVPDDFIDRVFATMALASQHTYQTLTKRPERILAYLSRERRPWPVCLTQAWVWPLPHVWPGFSAETREMFDERWERVRPLAEAGWTTWASLEPLLGPIILPDDFLRLAKWVVAGGESGPHARPAHPDWFRSMHYQCQAAGVPFFFKQWGEWAPKAAFSSFKEWDRAPKHALVLFSREFSIVNGRDVPDEEFGLTCADLDGNDGAAAMGWMGKKRAACLLDGREWKKFPRQTTSDK